MSTGIKTTYSRQEVRENREAFREWWWWTASSAEPDDRVTVLTPAHHAQTMQGFLCRCQQGWFWVTNVAELADKAEHGTPHSWYGVTRDLDGDAMRVPTEQELRMGGFRITVDPEPEEYPQQEEDEPNEETDAKDEANEEIHAGFYHLNRPTVDGLAATRAQAHFLASIAISLHELVALHKKYDPENMELIVDPGPELPSDRTDDKQAKPVNDTPPGPVVGEDFPFAR